MALPNTITNGEGHWPDATKLQENFDYLYALITGGGVLKQGTLQELKDYAALNPTVAFGCIDTDDYTVLTYVGNTSKGDGGFVISGGGL